MASPIPVTRRAATLVALAAVLAGGCGDDPASSSSSGASTSSAGAPGKTTEDFVATVTRPVAPATRAASRVPCRQFLAEVRPHETGAGLEDLIVQATAYRAARTRLADRLDGLNAEPGDAELIAVYTRQLRDGNGWLTTAITQAEAGDVEGAYGELERWNDSLRIEQQLVRALRLRVCR